MCGINMVLNFPEKGKAAIQSMVEATSHRGPDHHGYREISPRLFLGGNRLKTVDLGDWANPPISIDQGRHTLVWNGAIYNADDLRNQLIREGEEFESHSDTEILLKWLKRRGADGIKDLHGMYAFIYVDKAAGRLYVARDPHGMKPLYYFHTGDQWLVSSEARAIIQSGLVPKKLDESQLIPYYYSRHSFPDRSFFQHIHQLAPGNLLEIDLAGAVLQKRDIPIPMSKQPPPSKKAVKECLTDAVLRHFQADVPIGILLSGGVDSTMLLHTWMEETDLPIHTFTVTFDKAYQSRYTDPLFAQQVAKRYRCAHHEIFISPEIVLDNWPKYIASLDQPVGDSASFLSWMVAKEARKHVKILMSGAGADELFGGYNRHEAFRIYLKNHRLSTTAAKMGRQLPIPNRSMRKWLEGIREDHKSTFLNFSSLQPIPEPLKDQFLAYYPTLSDPFKAALDWDRTYYLVNDVLKIHDNALMAHGVEGRAPYLDLGLVNISRSMSEMQQLALRPKQWLRELADEAGWGNIAARKKMGFGIPIKEWMKENSQFRSKVLENIRNLQCKSDLYLPKEVESITGNMEQAVPHRFLEIWNLFVLASWCAHHQL